MANNGRLEPTLLRNGAGLHVPGELCAALDAALALLAEYEARCKPPSAVVQPRFSAMLANLRVAVHSAAVEHEQRRHRDFASWTTPPPQLGGLPHQQPPSVTDEITLRVAAELAGHTPEWWRRLVTSGRIPGRRIAGCWWISKAAVLARKEETRSANPNDTG